MCYLGRHSARTRNAHPITACIGGKSRKKCGEKQIFERKVFKDLKDFKDIREKPTLPTLKAARVAAATLKRQA